MDSPERNKIVTSTPSASPAVQDSPFFNYLSNLSPIKPVKVAHVARAFSELNFPPPPPVFTSPRINPQPETSFLKRSQYPLSAEFSLEHDDKGKMFTECSDVSRRPVTRSMVGLIPCTQKEFDSKGSVQVQPSSPSGCVDEYLADPVEVECANSAGSDDLCLEHADNASQMLQSGCMRAKETILNLGDYGDVTTKDMETEMAAQLTSLEQSEEDVLGKSPFHVKPGGEPSRVCPDGMSEKVNDLVLYNLSPESASGAQHCQHLAVEVATKFSSMLSKEHDIVDFDKKKSTSSESLCHYRLQDVKLQDADGVQQVEYDCNLHLLPEFSQIVPENVNPDKNSGAISNGLVEIDFEEASQRQRGTRRRCLQFEAAEARRNTIGNSCSFWNPKEIFPNSKLPSNPTDSDILDLSNLESSATSRSNQLINISHPGISRSTLCSVKTSKVCPDKVDRSARNIGNSLITAPMPSGIGLHLNSIVNATKVGCIEAPSMESAGKDNSSLQWEKPPSVIKHCLPEESKSNPLPTSFAGNISANNNDDQSESQAIVPESSATFNSPYENADTFEEFNKLSPKKKRKKTSYTMENEGCKRCNCKRSKCLKLYCECFAAGIYCAEPCACQECFNKPEYEDTVLGTRQQIESRNPLAFASKIVCRVTESPANSGEDGGRMTPSSARHRRGCNCKKSMCLKKYCECYQSGVGCSDGCRCEGCKNIFGIKEGYRGTTEMVYRRDDDESWEDKSDGNLDMLDTRSNFLHPEQCHAHNLSPLTPSFQYSSNREEVPKSRLPASRYLPSPESDTNILSLYGKCPRSPRNSNSHDGETKLGEGSMEIVSYNMELECNMAQTVDQFLPRWDGPADISDLTPLPHPPSRVTVSSSSLNTKDSTKVSRVQLCRGSVRLSSASSLHWRSSPITPLPRLGGSNLPQEPGSDTGYEILEDDTPEILKDTPTPIKAVKVSSPNQKRVSPPHSHLHDLRSNSSLGLRSGRKFVLQSISSFPPLTPHSDPKDSSDK